MTRVYLGFAADLNAVLARMGPLVTEYGDEWQAAAAVIPGLDAKVRDQLAAEHLVRCYGLAQKRAVGERAAAAREGKAGRPSGSPNRTAEFLKELGVTSGEVKAWAVYQGLLTEIRRGQVSHDLVELYAVAHEDPVGSPQPA